eukprot:5346292-Prymnesium_polylepis.1
MKSQRREFQRDAAALPAWRDMKGWGLWGRGREVGTVWWVDGWNYEGTRAGGGQCGGWTFGTT